MRKRILRSSYMLSPWLIQEIIIFIQAFSLALSCITLTMTVQYVKHSFWVIQECAPANTLFFLPTYRLERNVAMNYALGESSVLDANTTAELNRTFPNASFGRVLQTGVKLNSGLEIQGLGYNNEMCANTNLCTQQGKWLDIAEIIDGRIPVVIRGTLTNEYKLNDIIDFSIYSFEYDVQPVVVSGYVAGIIREDEIVFFPSVGASMPTAGSLVGRDVYISSNEGGVYGNSGMMIFNYEQLPAGNYPIGSCRYIFTQGEDSYEDVHFPFGSAWSVKTIVNNSIYDFINIYRDKIAEMLALFLCSITALAGYSILWYCRNRTILNVCITLGMTRSGIANICNVQVLSIMLLGMVCAFVVSPRALDALFLQVELNAQVYLMAGMCVLFVALCATLIIRVYSRLGKFGQNTRG